MLQPPRSSLLPKNITCDPPRGVRVDKTPVAKGDCLTFFCMCSASFRELLHRYTLPMFRDSLLVVGMCKTEAPSVVSKFQHINRFLAGMRDSDILIYTGVDTLFFGRMEEALSQEMASYDFRYASEGRGGGVNGDFLVMRGTDATRDLLRKAAAEFDKAGGRETDQSILGRLSTGSSVRSGPLSLRFLNQSAHPSEQDIATCLFFHANCRWGLPDKITLLEQTLKVRRARTGYTFPIGRATIEWREV